MPSDVAELERGIGRLEPIVIVHSRSPSAQPRVVPSLNLSEGGQRWLFYFLVREPELVDVVTEHVPAQGYWAIDVVRSPVIEFTSSFFDGEVLRRGRIYCVDGFYREGAGWVEKPQRFRTWARAVLRTARKTLKRRGTDYIGLEALAWLQREKGQLVE
jgi:hypothetical protein